MRVLITGGSSIVGLELAKEIGLHGHSSVIFDRIAPSETVPGTDYVWGDILDIPALRRAAAHCDCGIHLAVISDALKPEEMLSINVIGAYNFLKIAEERRFKNAIVAGSAPVHLPDVQTERWPLFPTSSGGDRLYDLTKIIQEVVAKEFSDHGLPVTCLRFGHLVRGEEETTLEGTRTLKEVEYCRGGWVALEDVVEGCYRALAIDLSPTFRLLNLIGASPGYESYRVKATEDLLQFNLSYRFEAY